MATTTDLIRDVYASFLETYARRTDTGADTVLFFEAAGVSPGLNPGVAGAQAAALEFISNEANCLPDLTTDVYQRSQRTIASNYARLLNAATPISEAAATTLGGLKADGLEALDNSRLGSKDGAVQFLPAFATPQDWYDAGQADNWSHYFYTATPPAQGQPNPAPQAPPPVKLPVWRMVSTAEAVATTSSAASQPVLTAVRPPWVSSEQLTTTRAGLASLSVASTRRFDAVAVRHALPTLASSTERLTTPYSAIHLETLVLNNSSNEPVLQPQFSMSFDYCVVELNRHWYSGDFLACDQWYVSGEQAGSYASGPRGVSASAADSLATIAATANQGFFAWIPTAFVAIKSLSVALTEGPVDPALSQAITSFGPFSFAPGTSTSGLLNRGIAIVAWICKAQPLLPPQSDPALKSTSVAPVNVPAASGAPLVTPV